MSERGSWASRMTYCDACAEKLRTHLIGSGYDPVRIALNRFAGEVGGLYGGEEVDQMEINLRDLGPKLCKGHHVEVVVLPDSGNITVLTIRHGRKLARSRARAVAPAP